MKEGHSPLLAALPAIQIIVKLATSPEVVFSGAGGGLGGGVGSLVDSFTSVRGRLKKNSLVLIESPITMTNIRMNRIDLSNFLKRIALFSFD